MQCAHSVDLPARIHRDGRPPGECLCVYVDSIVDGADCTDGVPVPVASSLSSPPSFFSGRPTQRELLDDAAAVVALPRPLPLR